MDAYKQKVLDSYSTGLEAFRAEKAGPYGQEFHYTKKLLDPYITSEKDVIELGCGGGYYGLYYAERCNSYLGVDLSPVNIAAFQQEISKAGYQNVTAQIGDATALTDIPDNAFDVVLCLGPMYHLRHEDRQACMKECQRICKPGGLIALAFINKTGAIAKFAPAVGWPRVLTPEIDHFVLDLGTDDAHPDVFFYTMPEEISKDATDAGLEVVTLAGLDFLIFEHEIELLSDAQRAILFRILDTMHESPYCSGLANHAMLLCKKP
jgi:2-polyprenyl-3-methyl-5-hydroxy-6-metoxy-1,4-benzoquinol methylase